MSTGIPIEDAARVNEVRHVAQVMAKQAGLSEAMCSNVAIVASEIASNGLKHAQKAEVHVTLCPQPGIAGVDILSIDRGPGMVNTVDCLQDGYSSVGTSGTGFGAIARLSYEFDLYSQSGKGTVVFARVGTGTSDKTSISVAGICLPINGESVSGDAWSFRREGSSDWLIVSDGLGHGILAHAASVGALEAFLQCSADRPAAILDRVHRALRGTRGAAVSIAELNSDECDLRYSGVGNISGVLLSDRKPQSMTSQNGTAGHESGRIQEFRYALPQEWNFVMHSDGLITSWRDLSPFPGLARRHPGVIAGILYRDFSRHRDDVCVVVAQKRGAA